MGGIRIVWVRAFGVPVHAWRRNVFAIMVTTFRVLVEMDPVIESLQRLDATRLLVEHPWWNSSIEL